VCSSDLLRPPVYRRYYEVARDLPDYPVVEVGAASGASSIALAWGMQDSNKTSSLIVVEKCEGGSRMDYGDYSDNYDIIVQNFHKFNVQDRIKLYPHYLTFENGHEVQALIDSDHIAALVHDADGRVDRDFALFYDKLVDGGRIIIDDYANIAKFKPPSARVPDGGTKMLTTYRLVNQLRDWGLLAVDEILEGTLFGHKPSGVDTGRLDLTVCEQIVTDVIAERDAHLQTS